MAYYDTTWYCNFGNGTSTGYYAVTVRPQNAAVAAGVLRRQFTAPAVGSERVFVCIVAGTTANVTDATWVLTRGAKTTDGTVTWMECSGQAALNGDLTNTQTWAQVKAAASNPSLGVVIQRNSGASYQICTTSGTLGASEPAFSNTAGTTTSESGGSAVWTSLGAVGTYTGGQAPHARLGNVFGTSWFIAGNTIYVGSNHAETVAATNTITTVGSSAGLIGKILCHNNAGSYPPAAGDLTTGATISTTGNNTLTLTVAGALYVYGLTFKAAVGGSTGSTTLLAIQLQTPNNQDWLYFDNCSLQIGSTGTLVALQLGNPVNSALNTIILNNTTVSFGSTGQYLWPVFVRLRWQNTGTVLAGGSSVPTALFNNTNVAQGLLSDIVLEALDLSQLSGSLVGASNPAMGSILITDCKLHASATVTTPASTGMNVQLVRCNSGAVAYTSSRYQYEGTETTETSITRVGGAVDPTGQAQSRKIVTSANAQWLRAFSAEPYAIWNVTSGATVTVTVYGTINAGAVPNNDDIWLEVEYLSSAATPIGTIVTTTKASLLASNAAVASDGSSWNGGGSSGGWSPFKLVATLSSPQPGMAGYLNARVRAAKASATYYIDPKIELT